MVRRTIKRRIAEGYDYERNVVTKLAELVPGALAAETRAKIECLVLRAARAYDDETDLEKAAAKEDRRWKRAHSIGEILEELQRDIEAAKRGEPAEGYSLRRHTNLSDEEWLKAAKSTVSFLHDMELASTSELIDAEVEENSRNAEHHFHAFCRRILKAYAIAAGIGAMEVKVSEYIRPNPVPGQLPSAVAFIKAIVEATCGRTLSLHSIHRAAKIGQQGIKNSAGALSD